MELKTKSASKKIERASNIEFLDEDIDGEYFTVKRSYLMRPSTVRKLNALNRLLKEVLLGLLLSRYKGAPGGAPFCSSTIVIINIFSYSQE